MGSMGAMSRDRIAAAVPHWIAEVAKIVNYATIFLAGLVLVTASLMAFGSGLLPDYERRFTGEGTLVCCGALWTPRCRLPYHVTVL